MLSKDESVKQSSQGYFISILKKRDSDKRKITMTKWKKKITNAPLRHVIAAYSYKTFINNNKMPDTVMKGELLEC